MMKRILALLFLICILFVFVSCSSASEIYGAWYFDEDGIRNAIQFSENKNGDDVFAWVVYDIENDEQTSVSQGYFQAYDGSLTLDFLNSDYDLSLSYVLDGEKLSLTYDTTTLVFTKKVLE